MDDYQAAADDSLNEKKKKKPYGNGSLFRFIAIKSERK